MALPYTLPHALWGSATVNGVPAAAGAEVEARGPGVRYDVRGNPLQVTVPGQYGGQRPWDQKLVIQGHIDHEAEIQLFVAGVPAQTVQFRTGTVERLDLVATGAPVPPPVIPEWYVYSWYGELIQAEPADAPVPDGLFVEILMRRAYDRLRMPPAWRYLKGDLFEMGQAMGLGRPITGRWTEIPWAFQGFSSGVLVVSMGTEL